VNGLCQLAPGGREPKNLHGGPPVAGGFRYGNEIQKVGKEKGGAGHVRVLDGPKERGAEEGESLPLAHLPILEKDAYH